MDRNVFGRMTAEGRLLGLNPGDWSLLIGGFVLVAALGVLLL
jgi:hypothetical protein